VVEEELTLESEGPLIENNSNCDIRVEEPESSHQGKPQCILPFLVVYKNFLTLGDALGDRSCVLNN
jgi:hypothetical protein